MATLLVLTSARAAGTIHYVDCAAGNDANDGASPTTAWRTTTHANGHVYGPGDQVLFQRGTVCSGEGFKPTGSGVVGSPVIVADYGTGNLPVIDGVGAHEPALLLLNVQNYTIRNLDLTQHGQAPQTIKDDGKDSNQISDETMRAVVHNLGLGPLGVQDCGEPCTVRYIRMEGLKVHDSTCYFWGSSASNLLGERFSETLFETYLSVWEGKRIMSENAVRSIGEKVRLVTDFESAYTRTVEALKAEGFGVLTEIDVKETMKKKLGVDFPPYKILGACNPPLSYRALTTAPEVGLLLPCNVTVRMLEDGGVEVALVDPLSMLGVVSAPELQPVAEEAAARLKRVRQALEQSA